MQQIYHVSFMSFTLFSTVVGVVCAQLAGFVFGWVDLKDVDVELLAPCMRRFYRKHHYDSVQLTEGVLKADSQKS